MNDTNKHSVTSPHDRFFKQLFSDKEKVIAFLQGSLPDSISQRIRYNSLEMDSASYVDEELKNHFADIVYHCEYGENTPLKIALLFEHKSTVPDYPHIQLLRYMVRMWEQQIKNQESFSTSGEFPTG